MIRFEKIAYIGPEAVPLRADQFRQNAPHSLHSQIRKTITASGSSPLVLIKQPIDARCVSAVRSVTAGNPWSGARQTTCVPL